ncbi:uncharacterized protein B0T23DRAFT_149645 [Neurospora hispaniola]|uniref:Uncharacterized protein n=1 Tax=Neurospora hispaniola TaxID=588809 RepID=A0AAJ0I8K7_9PEZI|nr:hypothetical protein B0T23DRAFT_149645 [Neurospora hispaniola]
MDGQGVPPIETSFCCHLQGLQILGVADWTFARPATISSLGRMDWNGQLGYIKSSQSLPSLDASHLQNGVDKETLIGLHSTIKCLLFWGYPVLLYLCLYHVVLQAKTSNTLRTRTSSTPLKPLARFASEVAAAPRASESESDSADVWHWATARTRQFWQRKAVSTRLRLQPPRCTHY